MHVEPLRILMYSHDTYGLGHITRTLRIARALRQASEHASVLIMTGSPVAPYMPLPEGADLVKMPSVVKAGPDEYRSRDLEISFRRIKRMRRDLIRGTCENFRPHLFLVDNVPLGMKAEILPALRYLRKDCPGTRIVLSLRDILDDPAVIEAAWERDGVRSVLDEYYDRIIVLGDPDFFDAGAAYRLPVEKTVHVGYAAPSGARLTAEPRAETPDRPHGGKTGRTGQRILVTAGGGGDGVEFLKVVIAGLAKVLSSATGTNGRGLKLEVVTGPLMECEERGRIKRDAAALGAETFEFVPDIPRRMARADLVISMAGYNTCCEVLAHARASLLFPRETPRVEQLMRADVLRAHGLVRMLAPHQKTPETVAEEVLRALAAGPTLHADQLPAMGGLVRYAQEIHSLLFPGEMKGRAGRRVPLMPAVDGKETIRDAGRAARSGPTSIEPEGRTRGMANGRDADMGRKAFWYWPGSTSFPQPARQHPFAGGDR